jgi:hypothetical protein
MVLVFVTVNARSYWRGADNAKSTKGFKVWRGKGKSEPLQGKNGKQRVERIR